MKQSDIGVVLAFYAVACFFLILVLKLPEEVQTYPLVIIAGLGILNTLYLIRSFLSRKKDESKDLAVIFKDFQTKQFVVVLAACLAYIALLPVLGFYIASALFLVLTMLFLKVPPKHIAMTIIAMAAIIYFVFTLFLKVPLPLGKLFQ